MCRSASCRAAWYVFRSHDVGIDDLPFESDGKRRTLDAFRVELFDLFDASRHADADFGWTRYQNEWARFLDERTPLDPELFRYQMRMNDSESGAGELVSRLSSPEDVVRFFIEALNDDVALGDFAKTLGEYAASAAQRGTWETEHGFCAALADGLALLADTHRQLTDWKQVQETSRLAVTELTSGIVNRIASERTAVHELEFDHARASQQVEDLRRVDNSGEDTRAQLSLERARLAAADATETVERCTDERDAADADRDAWAAVTVIQDWTTARSRAEEARLAYEKAEQGLAPAPCTRAESRRQARVEVTGARRRRAPTGRRGTRTRAGGDRDAKTPGATRTKPGRHATAWHSNCVGSTNAARTSTTPSLNCDVPACSPRPNHRQTASNATTVSVARSWHDATPHAVAVLPSRSSCVSSTPTEPGPNVRCATRSRKPTAPNGSSTRTRRNARHARDERIVAELAAGPIDDVRHAARLQPLAEDHAKQAEHNAAALEERREQSNAELDVLERDELASAPADVQLVCDTLVAAGIGTTTGLSWLARNVADPGERERVIERNPALANGVVVSDPACVRHSTRAAPARTAPHPVIRARHRLATCAHCRRARRGRVDHPTPRRHTVARHLGSHLGRRDGRRAPRRTDRSRDRGEGQQRTCDGSPYRRG